MGCGPRQADMPRTPQNRAQTRSTRVQRTGRRHVATCFVRVVVLPIECGRVSCVLRMGESAIIAIVLRD